LASQTADKTVDLTAGLWAVCSVDLKAHQMAAHSVAWMDRLKVVRLASQTADQTVDLTAGLWAVCSVDLKAHQMAAHSVAWTARLKVVQLASQTDQTVDLTVAQMEETHTIELLD
jgi:predicted hotdog family 3-hydroxylacyl-ACP dehydratase